MSGFDLSPTGQLLLLMALIGSAPLLWLWQRHRGVGLAGRLAGLTVLTLFLCFDLILFGAFTRLTDSGLGCPDWPGCYGSASPMGAHEQIHAAQAAMPGGPVTHGKAWVEMVHRYLAGAVGFLILSLCLASWTLRWRRPGGVAPATPWWATLTLAWVILQGAFGALTVTMKLFPLIVTLHLMCALALLGLLAWQAQAYQVRPLRLPRGFELAAWLLLIISALQMALGGWVSTNYAVLACNTFPQCQGGWWPAMDFGQAFTLWRSLGHTADGQLLGFAALTAIHWAHRLGAVLVLSAMLVLALLLRAHGGQAARPWARGLALLAGWQFLSGLSNVVLDWPMVAALAHTGGAAALTAGLSTFLARVRQARLRDLAALAPTSTFGMARS
ncbi:MAG: COX15/CtaA family protein [Burkholderiaceae bacterium]|nr:COX15/CtaA family protein [Roseateles sp.]MBV8470954.1 COX15/CtaA family protein [Burkholderiaceae bacterium]